MKNLFIKKKIKDETPKQVWGDSHLVRNDDSLILNNRGFTMIETLVAIFVLLIATTGPLAFTQSGLQASFLARDQVTAFYLAQESIETIKNIRDHNAINLSDDWLDGLEDCTPPSDEKVISCNIQIISDTFDDEPCTGNSEGKCSPMSYDSANNQFLISGGTETSKYTRTVYISKITDEEIQIVVEVSWESQFGPEKRIIVQENIFKK